MRLRTATHGSNLSVIRNMSVPLLRARLFLLGAGTSGHVRPPACLTNNSDTCSIPPEHNIQTGLVSSECSCLVQGSRLAVKRNLHMRGSYESKIHVFYLHVWSFCCTAVSRRSSVF